MYFKLQRRFQLVVRAEIGEFFGENRSGIAKATKILKIASCNQQTLESLPQQNHSLRELAANSIY